MPRPKLAEKDKKDTVPLRLPKEAVAAIERIASVWGSKTGKEVKRATVARELVLIGLGVLTNIQQSKLITDLVQRGPSDRDYEARLAEIAALASSLTSSLKYFDPEDSGPIPIRGGDDSEDLSSEEDSHVVGGFRKEFKVT